MDPDAELARAGAELAEALTASLPGWAERVVRERSASQPAGADAALASRARAVGADAAEAVGPELRALLTADVDHQRQNPMAVVRRAVAWPTAVLRDAGAEPPERDDYARRHFPDDIYGITPTSFADLDPELAEMGLVWGALKARAHLARHRRP
ncbi:MAG TPA: hypothetical protein VFW24_05080 [Acidimicrobiales bacterium]|nr:hypothetical protein [Acidimicrobiales bacterium]